MIEIKHFPQGRGNKVYPAVTPYNPKELLLNLRRIVRACEGEDNHALYQCMNAHFSAGYLPETLSEESKSEMAKVLVKRLNRDLALLGLKDHMEVKHKGKFKATLIETKVSPSKKDLVELIEDAESTPTSISLESRIEALEATNAILLEAVANLQELIN